jgi:UDP-N-acetylglucosamine 2-epimerase (non-hydrolysing)
MRILTVVGARPNFMKIAPFLREIVKYNVENKSQIQNSLIHSGQHYDDFMSKNFFESLKIPKPEINLNVGSGSHAEQIGKTMISFEKIILEQKPDWVVVVGDVNATLACSVIAKKHHINVCHIEAGLRSGDITMPEEINRIVTDRLSDLLLTPDYFSSDNLRKERIPEERIGFVGNIMIDALDNNKEEASKLKIDRIISDNLIKGQGLVPIVKKHDYKQDCEFGLVTMHRPSNVDQRNVLKNIVDYFKNDIARELLLIWPIHPRSEMRLKEFGLWNKLIENDNFLLLHPINYHEMLRLNMSAKVMFTDSGGLQEECTVLGTPCITLRWNTERPITLRENGGVSVLVGNNVDLIRIEYDKSINYERNPFRPDLWDGRTAERCVDALMNFHN